MFVIIAGQVGSGFGRDPVVGALDELSARFAASYPLAPERTAGDELQAMTENAGAALETALHLLRAPHWRVGLGIGAVRTPLPKSISEAAGPAFVVARTAIERAAQRTTRFASIGADAAATRGEHARALIDLLLVHRARWSRPGWQLHDLLESGLSQAEAAVQLGVTPQATSKRARAAGLKVDADARRALIALLSEVGNTAEHGASGDGAFGNGAP